MIRRLLGLGSSAKKVPLVVLEGTIKSGGQGINWSNTRGMLEKAFTKFDSKDIAILINSPGGSPAQSSLIYKEISTLKVRHEKKVTIFVSDAAASGGYYIASAGDEILVDPNSVIGSIGVVSQWFGVSELMSKIGVKPRIYTAGENKSFLSPFKDEPSDEDLKRLREIQTQIHDNFVQVVKDSRGEKLSKISNDDELFNGNVFIGAEAVRVGLADKVESPLEWLGDRKFQVLKSRSGFFARFMSAEALARAFLQTIESNSKMSWKM